MERLTFTKARGISVAALPCIMLCIIAYVVMAAGIVGLTTLVLGLL
jgi:hypothetical protein